MPSKQFDSDDVFRDIAVNDHTTNVSFDTAITS